jgi:hypothetical protein
VTTFDIILPAVGGPGGSITINGEDRTADCSGVVVESYVGEPTKVTLLLAPGATGAVAGEAVVQSQVPADMLEQLAGLLEKLDPHDLNQRALNSDELDPADEDGITRQVLREAARLLRGRDAGT